LLNKGAAIARFDLVRIIDGGAPIAPKGDDVREDSFVASFHGSLGNVPVGIAVRAGGTARGEGRGEGLKEAAFAFNILGEARSESPDVSDAGGPCVITGDTVEDARPDGAKGIVGVVVPDMVGGRAGDGECGLPSGVLALKLGIRVGVYGRRGIAATDGELRARVGVIIGAGAKGTPSTSSIMRKWSISNPNGLMRYSPLRLCIQSKQT